MPSFDFGALWAALSAFNFAAAWELIKAFFTGLFG